jgi:tRNA(Ile)-lysidine synthase
MIADLLRRSTFPPAGTAVVCGLSGGADSTALVRLGVEAGCDVTALHVNHGLRPSADLDEACARRTAERLDVAFRAEHIELIDGPNLEARARVARQVVLGPDALKGHTADDQAETVLLALLRGSGANGLAAMTPGPTRPILALRRSETVALCEVEGLEIVHDPSNVDPRFRRNRVRHELLPLMNDLAERDMAPILARTAGLLRDDDALLERLADRIDPTDAISLAATPRPLARRAIRRWLEHGGYPPDAATVARVLDVAAGTSRSCDVGAGRRVTRHQQRLALVPASPAGDDARARTDDVIDPRSGC